MAATIRLPPSMRPCSYMQARVSVSSSFEFAADAVASALAKAVGAVIACTAR